MLNGIVWKFRTGVPWRDVPAVRLLEDAAHAVPALGRRRNLRPDAATRYECPGSPGRPRIRPDHVPGDKGSSSKTIRGWLRQRGIGHTIPERADQVANRLRRGRHGGRPVAFDRQLYTHRTVVERAFNRLKQWRGRATRYDKTAESYQAAVTIASPLMWA